jgi:sugar phosphate isomerase/epimerase
MMSIFKIGVMVDSFRLPITEGVKKAAEIGAEGIQVYAKEGQMAPENMDAAARRAFLDMVKSNGLVVSALCGDLGGHGFERKDDNVWKVEKSKRIVDLALDLDCRVVTTHIGTLPADKSESRRAVMMEACAVLGDYAAKSGAFFAIETGPEPASVLKEFLDEIGSKGMAVNFDPANLAMVVGEDPAETVSLLGPYIVHTHAKDGVMLKKTDPKIIYDCIAEGDIVDIRLDEYFAETPLGKGSVDFPRYLKNLAAAGFSGFLTIEREVGLNPEADIKLAVDFLKKLI